MKSRLLFAGTALICAVISLEAFDNYNQAFQAARKAGAAKQYDEAVKDLAESEKLAANVNQRAQSINYWADVLRWKKEFDAAEKKLAEIIADDKFSVEQKAAAQVKIAHFKNWRGQKTAALQEYQKVLDYKGIKRTYDQDAYTNMGGILLWQKKYDEAVKSFQKALERNAENPHAGYKASANIGMGRAYAAQKKYDEAQQSFRTVMEDASAHPNHRADAALAAARALAAQKKYDEAYEMFREVDSFEKASPFYRSASYREPANMMLIAQKRFDEARQLLDQAEASNLPDNQKAWINDYRAMIPRIQANEAIKAKQFDNAAKFLKDAEQCQNVSLSMKQQIAAEKMNLQLSLGRQLSWEEKKHEDAEIAFKKIFEIENAPKAANLNANHELARVMMRQKKFEDAKKYVDAALAFENPSANQIAMNNNLLADWLAGQGKHDEVVQTMEKTLAIPGNLNPNYKAAAYARIAGVYFHNKKDLAKANEYIKKSNAVPGATWTWGKSAYLTKRIQKALDEQK